MRKSDRVVMFPVYIDSSKARSEGRMIPKAKCVQSPRLGEMVEACRALGFEFSVDGNASHPAEPTERRGLLRAVKRGRKTEMLEKVALQIKRSRSEKAEKAKDK
ncbi:MAG: signal recognition particle subunit SRP19/SEC65 family protein [Candidatus Brockarchaeota archaeon]|nr:signal recognition particle subunit SRP19/SEC65 family protein [Candidatus Brockarchaeota archaeon]